MKLNRKGYMLVEIIIASVLAMTISYYLLNLTYKFKDNSQDLQESYTLMNDKILITKNIMKDLEKGTVTKIYEQKANYIIFELLEEVDGTPINSKRKLLIEGNKISYGKVIMDEMGIYIFNKDDLSYYEKELANYLVIDNIIYNTREYLNIEIPVKSIYGDIDYSIKLFCKRNYNS